MSNYIKVKFKKYKEIIFLSFISFLFLYPILSGGFYESHDGVAHLARIFQYEQAFRDGQIPPRWAKTLNFGYGSPLLIFFYPFPGYVSAIFHMVGVSFENSFLIIAALSSIIGCFSFYYWIKNNFNKDISLFSTILYTFLPYRFLTLFVRGGIGEFVGFSFIPVFLYLVDRKFKKISLRLIILASLAYSIIVLSHNVIVLLFSPILLFYGFLRGKKVFLAVVTSIYLGLMFSAFFWLPFLYESKYTNPLFYHGGMFKSHFPEISKLIYSTWGFGPDVNLPGGLSPQIGIIPVFVVLLSMFLYFRKKSKNCILICFWVIVFLSGIFLSTSYSSFIWEKSDILKKLYFPWRFIAVSSFASMAISPFLFKIIRNTKIIYIIIILAVFSSIPFLKVKQYVTHKDSYYIAYKGSTYFRNEATTLWTGGDPNKEAKKPIEIIAGQGEVNDLKLKSNIHQFEVKADTDMVILDNTIYFPGWTARVNGKKEIIQFQDMNHKGLITFPVPKGTSYVEVKFEETLVRKTSDVISLIGILILGLLFLASIPSLKKRFIKQ